MHDGGDDDDDQDTVQAVSLSGFLFDLQHCTASSFSLGFLGGQAGPIRGVWAANIGSLWQQSLRH
jgi:hypothetical protein